MVRKVIWGLFHVTIITWHCYVKWAHAVHFHAHSSTQCNGALKHTHTREPRFYPYTFDHETASTNKHTYNYVVLTRWRCAQLPCVYARMRMITYAMYVMISTLSSACWQQVSKLLALRRFELIWKD